MKSCLNCANAVYDDRFGEKRCRVYNHDVRDVDRYLDCKSHKDKGEEEVNNEQ